MNKEKNKPFFYAKKTLKNQREENQDASYLHPEKGILLLADGMGGIKHERGGEASLLTIYEMKNYLKEIDTLWRKGEIKSKDTLLWIKKSVAMAQESIEELATKTENFKNTGTTLEAGYLQHHIFHYAHVGDSATFIIRPNDTYHGMRGSIELLAEKDNTDAKDGLGGLEKYIGMPYLLQKDNAITAKTLILQKEDIIFSCTDGVTKPVVDEELLDIFLSTDLKDTPRIIKQRIKKPIYRKEQLKKQHQEKNLPMYLGDNATFIIYQIGK